MKLETKLILPFFFALDYNCHLILFALVQILISWLFDIKHRGFGVIEKSLKNSNQEGYNWVTISEDYACEIDKKMNHDLLNEYLPEIYTDTHKG